MHESWYEVFNTSRMLFFLAGLGLATVFWYQKCKREKVVLELAPVGIIAGVSIIVFLAIQQVGLATQMKVCQEHTNAVLAERAKLSDQSDTLAGEEITANSAWLQRLTSPPPDIAKYPTTNPVYRAWVQTTIRDYTVQLNQIQQKRKDSLEERKQKTYPSPTCGW